MMNNKRRKKNFKHFCWLKWLGYLFHQGSNPSQLLWSPKLSFWKNHSLPLIRKRRRRRRNYFSFVGINSEIFCANQSATKSIFQTLINLDDWSIAPLILVAADISILFQFRIKCQGSPFSPAKVKKQSKPALLFPTVTTFPGSVPLFLTSSKCCKVWRTLKSESSLNCFGNSGCWNNEKVAPGKISLILTAIKRSKIIFF